MDQRTSGRAVDTAIDEAVKESEAEPDARGYQKGGDKSDRAARSGATGESNPEGAANKPEPKNPDEKGLARKRNR